MYDGPFYICWDEGSTDEKIIQRFKKYGARGFAKTPKLVQCGDCKVKDCPINTGREKEMRKVSIYVDQNNVIKVIHSAD